MRAIKKLIIALLSFLLLFLIASFADISLRVRADVPSDLSFSRQRIFPTAYWPKPTWWPPRPTFIPTPTWIPNPPSDRQGEVNLSAFVSACGHKSPFAGVFQLCRGKLMTKSDMPKALQPVSCLSLTTDEKGQGSVTAHPGLYTIRPPYWCPPGAYCIALLIADPYTWQIHPQNFYLPPDGAVQVDAIGYNNLLMCPIQAEE